MRSMSWTIALFLIASQAFAGELRTWQAAAGPFKVEAEFVSQTDVLVVLKKQDGTELKVPKDKLSAADHDFLKKSQEALAETPKSEPSSKPTIKPPTIKPWNEEYIKAQKPIPDEPGTDYAKLAKELLTPAALPEFKLLNKFEITLASPYKAGSSNPVLSESGKHLCIYDEVTESLAVWNIEQGKVQHTWNCGKLSNPFCFAISPSGRYLAIGREDAIVVTYDAEQGKQLYEHDLLKVAGRKVLRVAYDWKEESIYFLSHIGKANAVPIAGGKGFITAFPLEERTPTRKDDIRFHISVNGTIGLGSTLNNYSIHHAVEETFLLSNSQENLVALSLDSGIFSITPKRAARYIKQMPLQINDREFFNGQLRDGTSRNTPVQLSAPRNEQYFWALGRTALSKPIIDIFSKNSFGTSLTVPVPYQQEFTPHDSEWLAAEANRLVHWSYKDKNLYLYELSKIEPLAAWKITSTLQQSFVEKRYDRIDGLIRELAKSNTAIQGGSGQPILNELVETFPLTQFLEHEDLWRARIKLWLTEQPKSDFARMVRAQQLICEGFAARGNGRASEVTEKGWEKLRECGKSATELLQPVLDQAEPPGEAFYLQLRAAKMLSWDLGQQLELAKRLLKVAPDYAPFHEEMVVNLLPRWYGEPGDIEKYATAVAEKMGKLRGEILYSRMVLRLTRYVPPQAFADETQLDMSRAFRALLFECSQHPERPEGPMLTRALLMYAEAAKENLAEKEEVLKEFETADELFGKHVNQGTWNAALAEQIPILKQIFQSR